MWSCFASTLKSSSHISLIILSSPKISKTMFTIRFFTFQNKRRHTIVPKYGKNPRHMPYNSREPVTVIESISLVKTPQPYKAQLRFCTLGTFSWIIFNTFSVFSTFSTLVFLWIICLSCWKSFYDTNRRHTILLEGLQPKIVPTTAQLI